MRNFTLFSAFVALFGWQASAQITTYPYLEDFEGGAGGWTVGGGFSTWALGAPAGFTINTAASGTNSWVTNLNGNYSNGESGHVQSPEFDFTAVAAPSIVFSLWVNTETWYDGFVLQSSIDGGSTWQNVGGVEPNWYNNASIWGNPGGQSIGWDGSAMTGWINASHALTGLGGQSSVFLRMAFGSDGSVTYDGIGFDDVFVYNETCPVPSALSTSYLAPDTLIVSWTNGLSETAWNYEYGPTMGSFNSNPDTIVGVSPNMLYDLYLQADCGGGDLSIWQGPLLVSTLLNDEACNAIMVPVDGSTTMYSNVGATTQMGEPGSVENSVWFSAVVPTSGSLAIGTCGEMFDTELNVYSVTDCADFNTYTDLGYADYNPWGCAGWHPAGIELCGLTPGDTIMFWVDGYFGSEGTFPLSVWDLGTDPGVGTTADVCVGDSVNLWTMISGQSSNAGYWDYPSNPAGITNDSLFVTANATVGGDLIYYIISNACGSDTAMVYVNVFTSSNAGNDGSVTVCKNQPFDLLTSLSGNVDLGGQWYDPSNNPTASSFVIASPIPGQFNYDYVTTNGVCPNDTSNVIVTVSINCDYLDIEEMFFGNMTMYPNPTNGIVTITNNGSDEVFNYELTDVNGQVIATKDAAINGAETTEVNLGGLDSGLYFIKVFNENAEKTFRVVKQ
jgi:hypothetical protein